MGAHLMEWNTFKLRPAVSEQSLIAASEVLQREFLSLQPGFVRRQLLRAADGSYVDLVWWDSRQAASEAMTKAVGSQCSSAYFALMNDADPDARMHLFEAVADYSSMDQAGGKPALAQKSAPNKPLASVAFVRTPDPQPIPAAAGSGRPIQ
jgi:hypothetical protein